MASQLLLLAARQGSGSSLATAHGDQACMGGRGRKTTKKKGGRAQERRTAVGVGCGTEEGEEVSGSVAGGGSEVAGLVLLNSRPGAGRARQGCLLLLKLCRSRWNAVGPRAAFQGDDTQPPPPACLHPGSATSVRCTQSGLPTVH